MTKQIFHLVCIFTLSWQLSGCSMLTKNGRSKAAYDRYLKRSSSARAKNKLKYGKPKKMEKPIPSDEPAASENTGPEAVPNQ